MLLTVSFVFIVLTAPLSTLTALNRKGNILWHIVAFSNSFAMSGFQKGNVKYFPNGRISKELLQNNRCKQNKVFVAKS